LLSLSRVRLLLSVATLVVATSACGSDSSVGPGGGTRLTLTEVLNELSIAGVADVVAPFAAVVPSPAGAFEGAGCTYGAGTQSFVCPTVTFEGLTLTQSYSLLDAGGSPQSAYDAAKTAEVRGKSSITGRTTRSNYDLVADAQQDLTLGALFSESHTLDGTSSVHVTGTVSSGGVAAPVDVTASTKLDKLVLPVRPWRTTPWPRSGTVTVETTHVPGVGLPPITRRITLTFNGTSQVAVVATSGSVTINCTMDLTTAPTAGCPGL
jgi:hypothetical protein